jgi:hypothetical protein
MRGLPVLNRIPSDSLNKAAIAKVERTKAGNQSGPRIQK